MPDDIHRVRLLIRPMEMLPKMRQKHMRKMLYFVGGGGEWARSQLGRLMGSITHVVLRLWIAETSAVLAIYAASISWSLALTAGHSFSIML